MTVNDVIRIDIINDDTLISIFEFDGRKVSVDCRYYDADVSYRGLFEIYSLSYFPSTNSLYIFLAPSAMEAKR